MATRIGFRRARAGHANAAHALNLTPMIDVMVIILIFLVKSYSVTPEYLSPAKDVQLAAVTSDVSAPDKAVVIISPNGITIEDQQIVSFQGLKSNAFQAAVWPELQRALTRLQKNKKFLNSDTLIIQADRGLPFEYLKPVIRTAGASGFRDIKFAGVFED